MRCPVKGPMTKHTGVSYYKFNEMEGALFTSISLRRTKSDGWRSILIDLSILFKASS